MLCFALQMANGFFKNNRIKHLLSINKIYTVSVVSAGVFDKTFMFSIFKNRDFVVLVCVSVKSCSLTIYTF